MQEDLKQAYLRIFDKKEEDFTLVGVKSLGKYQKQNSDGSMVYKFLAVVTCPADVFEMTPTSNEWVALRDAVATEFNQKGGPSFAHQVEWKKKVDHNGKEKIKTKSFEIRGDVKPTSVLDWEIFNNTYYIKVEAYGVF